MYAVIIASGGDTGLQPLTRPDRPAAFLPLLDDRTLLQHAVRRLLEGDELALTEDDVWVVTEQRFGHLVREQVPSVGMIVEPIGKNTAASVGLATAAIGRSPDEEMLVLPAHGWLPPGAGVEAAFRSALATAARLATGDEAAGEDGPLVALGVPPAGDAPERGYVRPDTARARRVDGHRAFPVLAFEDGPADTRARDLRNLPGTAWDAGIYAWRRRAVQSALEKYTPLMTMIGTAAGSDIALRGAYERLLPMSVGKAVLEGAAGDRRMLMLRLDIGWSRIETWSDLLAAMAGDRVGNATARVARVGEQVELGPEDLVVGSSGGRILADSAEGPWTVASATAVLDNARHLSDDVHQLVERVGRA